ncbi:hypothetical protein N657DRAFT_320023 [Parathielavia appendiculata]|uniref:Uncharacterized protein n=1 Tax=Parathielavia appendiculata TaxID=2587402 RepID=A0AAN6YZ83_9PEZI|nr:hypothetical protein N657DRAFT_320023 [Parathielavia appendiculata]
MHVIRVVRLQGYNCLPLPNKPLGPASGPAPNEASVALSPRVVMSCPSSPYPKTVLLLLYPRDLSRKFQVL